MRKLTLVFFLLFIACSSFCQAIKPKIDVYAAPGLFLEGFNHNALVPAHLYNATRLGDEASYGAVVNLPVKKGLYMIKAGLAYHEMHYSMTKYSLGDIIGALFLFDASPYNRDTFPISYVRFTNKYLEMPLAFGFHLSRRRKDLNGLSMGVYIKPAVLLNSHADIHIDSFGYRTQPVPGLQSAYEKLYTQDAAKFTITIEPYIEWSFHIYKGLGLITQIRPFSWYSSPLNKKFTNGTVHFFGFTGGIVYDFNH